MRKSDYLQLLRADIICFLEDSEYYGKNIKFQERHQLAKDVLTIFLRYVDNSNCIRKRID
jgi:uncharacterized membrane protein YcgQ (UPF0703/DUF1980 family)